VEDECAACLVIGTLVRGTVAVVIRTVLVVAAALGLAGCALAPSAGPSAPASAAHSRASATASPTGQLAARFGDTHTWPDGVSIRIGRPEAFLPSTWVREVNSFHRYLAVKVTLRNGADGRLDLSGFEADGRSSGKAADPLHDPGKLGTGAPTKLAKGDTAVFRLGFGVQRRAGFALRVELDPDHVVVFKH